MDSPLASPQASQDQGGLGLQNQTRTLAHALNSHSCAPGGIPGSGWHGTLFSPRFMEPPAASDLAESSLVSILEFPIMNLPTPPPTTFFWGPHHPRKHPSLQPGTLVNHLVSLGFLPPHQGAWFRNTVSQLLGFPQSSLKRLDLPGPMAWMRAVPL